jgi:hypothetical protein
MIGDNALGRFEILRSGRFDVTHHPDNTNRDALGPSRERQVTS